MHMVKLLFRAWVFSLGFIYLFDWPVVGTKVQLAELFFLLLAGVVLVEYGKESWAPLQKAFFSDFGKTVVGFLLVAFLAVLVHPTRTAVLEHIGLWYLVGSSLLVGMLFFTTEDFIPFCQRSFIQLGLLLSLSNIVIAILYLRYPSIVEGQVELKLIAPLGYFPRVQGWMPSTNLLADLLTLCWFLALAEEIPTKRFRYSGLILVGLILTFSKSLVVILPFGVLLSLIYLRVRHRFLLWGARGIVITASFIFVFLSHFLVQPKISETLRDTLSRQSYLTGKVLLENEHLQIFETTLFRLKQMNVKAYLTHPVVGVGPGNFNLYLKKEQAAGHYPADVPVYDPHSTLGGTLAEMGSLGFLALLALMWMIFVKVKKRLSVHPHLIVYKALAFYFLFITIQTFTTDVLNFRHLWICIGMIGWPTGGQRKPTENNGK